MDLSPADTPRVRAVSADPDRARVLVVDDDERNLLAIRTVLEDVADIVEARSGEEALRHLLKHEFAVILLDVYMPGMDGYEVAQIVRGRDQSKRIPIVFLSAVNKETEHLIRGYSMGAVDYVFKPVEPVVLRSKVAVFVDLFRMRREIQQKAREQEELLKANLKTTAELIRAEQELRIAEQRQAAIINSLPIVLYLEPFDRRPRWPAFISGDLAAITGFTIEQIAENPHIWEERLHPEDRDRVLACLEERQTTGRLSIEYRWRASDDSYKHFLDQAVLLPDEDGGPGEFAGTLLDVTDRKALETQLLQAHKMDAIGKLTGGIAHDFNNLLAAVLGGIGLIERRLQLGDDQKKILGMTRHAAEQGTELVRRLLAFARRQKLQPASIVVKDMSVRLNELLAHTLGGLVEIRWDGMDRSWNAFADETQLELALMNLIINARDAMAEGGTITIAAANHRTADAAALSLPAGDYVTLAVSDTGEGIAPAMLEQVMEPFFTTKPVGKGTGLGLSMVYGFARQSGGGVHIESQVGRGTTVTIWLPRAPEQDGLLAAAGKDAAPDQAMRPLRILLVDDHEGVRTMTAAMLGELGHKVNAVGNGNSVVKRLKGGDKDWDLLITDYAMPTISGSELLRKAREHAPGLPGLLITGYADPDSIGSRPEDVEVLVKPFTIEQLRAAIGRCAGLG
ncbi:putative two-component hybrid sensor and regulator [Sphingomonas changbaiensis NBRC 104936]|uniref:histidine kinase n=1 Tax=Sphingomonas changbaiensis NBRC 104936 TaxID=1219043 RepID=A0A0E9MP03_9SPHN|nr:response regulator [Sphingomonas changbaiensis]GAO39156.1 putative two-component hybrid sensor and regulator [Sphingomonas changbaiensis NBRC 104936]